MLSSVQIRLADEQIPPGIMLSWVQIRLAKDSSISSAHLSFITEPTAWFWILDNIKFGTDFSFMFFFCNQFQSSSFLSHGYKRNYGNPRPTPYLMGEQVHHPKTHLALSLLWLIFHGQGIPTLTEGLEQGFPWSYESFHKNLHVNDLKGCRFSISLSSGQMSKFIEGWKSW